MSTTPGRLLVVEDEAALREALVYSLERQGYEVSTAADGPTAIATALRERPDLILLDIMLPGVDGLEVCRVLRRDLNTPILMLTARSEEVDKVVGLEVGADDYLTKPFSMRELHSRVKALLRRVRMIRQDVLDHEESDRLPARGRQLVFHDLIVDPVRGEVTLGGRVLDLNPKEYELLVFLAKHKGMVLSREQILERVWGWEYVGGSRTVDVHVRWLREKIEQDAAHPQRIVTVRGMGYRFEG